MISRRKMVSRTVLGVSAVVLGAYAGGAPVAAYAQSTPVVQYAPEAGARKLIFVNNPERIELGYTDVYAGSPTFGKTFSDLADPDLGNTTLHQITVQPGSYRNFFEHVYAVNDVRRVAPPSADTPIYYGVCVFNPNRTPITVTVYGKGYRTGFSGGQPIAEMLNDEAANPAGATFKVTPGKTLWVLRSDVDFEAPRPAFRTNFLSGIVDFDVEGGEAIVSNLAYQNFDESYGRPPIKAVFPFDEIAKHGGPADMGFMTRRYAPVTLSTAPESRVYKGLLKYPGDPEAGAGVRADVAFTIGDGTPGGDLNVTYPQWTLNGTTGGWQPSATNFTGPGWWTHNVPLRDTATVKVLTSDMFDIDVPGYGLLFARAQSNAPNTPFGQSNFGNWGVTYHDAVTVTNTGTRDRVVALRLNNSSGGGSPIAYRDGNGVWQHTIVRGTPVVYFAKTVPAGQTVTLDGYFLLGAPAVGTLRHSVNVGP